MSTSPHPRELPSLVVLGGLGDLALRHLLPALARLEATTGRHWVASVVCVDRSAGEIGELRSRVADQLTAQARDVPVTVRDSVLRRLDARRVDLGAPADPMLRLTAEGAAPVVYCALPAPALPDAIAWLARQRLPAGTRVAVEKPFGHDRSSARSLTADLERLPGATTYRVDHVLHHRFVRDLVARRLAAPEEWDHHTVSRIEVMWEEAVPVPDSRVPFYDQTGALRDMVQSHLLQLLALIAMDPPSSPHELAPAKAAVLGRVLEPTHDQLHRTSRRGRYTSGRHDGQVTPGYLEQTGVDPDRHTETFASVRLGLNDDRWRGVPFDLRAGKALARARKGVVVHRRHGATPVHITYDDPLVEAAHLPPSSLILQDLLSPQPTGAVSQPEVDECWRVTDAILAGWRQVRLPMLDYAAGSAGPTAGPPSK